MHRPKLPANFPGDAESTELARTDSRDVWVAAIVVAAVACFYCLTLRAGHVWGDDFAHYILQARSLSEGRSIAANNYIVNPTTVYLAPKVVPPGLSVILIPVVRLFGVNLTPMKILLSLIVAGAWGVFYFLCRLYLSRLWSVAAVLIVSLNPLVIDMRDSVTPEKPYYLFSLLAIYWLTKAYWHAPQEEPLMKLAIPLGIILYAAYATRNLSVALFPAVPIFDWLRMRRMTRFPVVVLAVTGILGLIHTIILSTASGYGQLFSLSPSWIVRSAVAFAIELSRFWSNGYSAALGGLLAAVILLC